MFVSLLIYMTSASSKEEDGATAQPNNTLCEECHDKDNGAGWCC